MPSRGDSYKLLGTVFSKVVTEKISGRRYEKVDMVIGELVPSGISLGCTAAKLSIPIPDSPAVRIRMGFQGPTLQIIAYLHTYEYYIGKPGYDDLIMCNWYDAWKNVVEIEDLIKVSMPSDNIIPSGYGNPVTMDGSISMDDEMSSWSAIPHIKPSTYWWVRKRDIIREAGWADKFRLELNLERSWQWSTSGRPRPARDVDDMACFKGGKIEYDILTSEYVVI